MPHEAQRIQRREAHCHDCPWCIEDRQDDGVEAEAKNHADQARHRVHFAAGVDVTLEGR